MRARLSWRYACSPSFGRAHLGFRCRNAGCLQLGRVDRSRIGVTVDDGCGVEHDVIVVDDFEHAAFFAGILSDVAASVYQSGDHVGNPADTCVFSGDSHDRGAHEKATNEDSGAECGHPGAADDP